MTDSWGGKAEEHATLDKTETDTMDHSIKLPAQFHFDYSELKSNTAEYILEIMIGDIYKANSIPSIEWNYGSTSSCTFTTSQFSSIMK